jgi:hypothetical protein
VCTSPEHNTLIIWFCCIWVIYGEHNTAHAMHSADGMYSVTNAHLPSTNELVPAQRRGQQSFAALCLHARR